MATNTYTKLSNLINASAASKAQLRFQGTSFATASQSLFDKEFIGGLNLLKPTLVGNSTDATFQLTGTSSNNPFILDGLKVSVDITNASGLINSAKATAPTSGTFKLLFNQSLPLLKVNYAISYNSPDYTLDYSINLDITTELGFLVNLLLPNTNPLDNFALSASIKTPTETDKTPYLVFAPPGDGMSFPAIGKYQVKDVAFNLLTFVSWAYEKPSTKEGKFPIATNTIQISGNAVFEQISKSIDLSAQFGLNSHLLFFSGQVVSSVTQKTVPLTFIDLLSLIPGANLSQTLPSNIPVIDSFGLTRFTTGINIQSTPKFNSFHVSLATDPSFSWDMIPNILTLEEVELDFGVILAGRSTSIDASFLGTFNLDTKYPFKVSGSYPQYVFRAFSAWKKADAPSIGDLLGGNLGNQGKLTNPFDNNQSGSGDPVIESVSITVDAKNKSYAASLLVDPEIKLSFGTSDPWFVVNEIGFDINYLKSNFSADLYGSVSIGTSTKINLYLSASYQKTGTVSSWEFAGGLQNEVTFKITDLLSDIGFNSPSWLSGDTFTIKTLWLTYSKQAAKSGYSFKLDVLWHIEIPNLHSGLDLEAIIEVSRAIGATQKEGLVKAIADFHGCSIAVGMTFKGAEKVYTLDVDLDDELKVSGTYDSVNKTASLIFNKIPSLGQVLTFLIKTAEPGMDLILPDPWDILNDIKIPGTITLDYDFKNKAISIDFQYDVDLVLVKLTDIKATYIPKSATQKKQVMISLKGSLITGESFNPGWNALKPQTAPKVPGKAAPFELHYLGLGQHVSPRKLSSINSVSDAINNLAHSFNQSGDSKADQPVSGTGLEYNSKAGWLVGADFSILEVFEMGFVFLDPLLYGMLIGVKAKPSAKPFGGLKFEIMYKKVNDTTGVYYIYLTLPTIMRHLEFGEVSVTLPSLKVWIYTDGSFKIDLGFPYHNNWKDSFGLEVFPFVGQGGFYFGVLKGADVKSLPNTYGNGVFNPVIELGVALRVGVGKDINEGILSAGISLTVAGVLQGMMTFYHPKNGGDKSIYFTISAMLAIIGKIYGSISFAIISARLNITASISARATFALYEPIHLRFKAYVSVELTVSIHLIFTIHIHLKFHATITEAFTIGHKTTPPWGTGPQSGGASQLGGRAAAGLGGMPAMSMLAMDVASTTITQDSFNIGTPILDPEQLNLLFSPHYTSSGGKAQAILMTYIDTYTYEQGENKATASNSFANLGTGLVRWLATTVLVAEGITSITQINSGGGARFLDQQTITATQLQNLATYFADNKNQPFSWQQAKDFIENFFSITIQLPADLTPFPNPYHSTVFPMIPSLEILVPNEAVIYGDSGIAPKIIEFSSANPAVGYTPDQLILLNEYLQFLKVHNQNAADQKKHQPKFNGTLISTAQIIFVDFVAMMAKQVVQDSNALFREYDVPHTGAKTFTSYIDQFGLSSADYSQILYDNRDQTLASTFNVQLATVTYQLKKSDITGTVDADLTKIITTNLFGSLTAQDILTANPGIHRVKQGTASVVTLLPGEIIDIPPFQQAVSGVTGVTTLLDLANHYHVNLQDVITVQLRQISGVNWSTPMTAANQDVVMNNIFATATGNTLRLCNLKQITVGDLTDALKANSTFANLSGMAARFMMHGLQLPSPADVQKAVNHEDTNPLVGLYQMTQQQIGVSKIVLGDEMGIRINPDPNYALSNLTVPQSPYTFQAKDLSVITSMTGNFSSFGTFDNLSSIEMFLIKEKHFALHNKISVTTPEPFTTAPGPSTLWKLDRHLLQVLQHQPASGYTFQLYSKRQLTQTNVEEDRLQSFFMPSSFLKFQVRRVKISHSSSEFIPNVYEIHSVETESIRLLTQLEEAGAIATPLVFRLMYPDKPIRNGYETPQKLIDGGPSNATAGAPDLFFVQSNLSEVAYPVADPSTPINEQITRYLLEAGVVHTGGYYMYYQNPHTKAGLPDHLFSSKQPDTELILLVSYAYSESPNNNYAIEPFHNYITYQGQVNQDGENLYLESYGDPISGYDPAVQHQAAISPPGNGRF